MGCFCNKIRVFVKVYTKFVGYYIKTQYLCRQNKRRYKNDETSIKK